jgi:hypothetical protein
MFEFDTRPVFRMRPWCEIGSRDRGFRLLAVAGFLTFAIGWTAEMILTSDAIRQPHVATAVFRNAWTYKCRIGWMTDTQIVWAHVASVILPAGWVVFAIGVAWTRVVELRAAKAARKARAAAALQDS